MARLFTLKPELREAIIAGTDPTRVVELLQGDDAAEVNYTFETPTES